MNKKPPPKHFKIEKIRIPDEDMPNWIKALREGGFNDEEIDLILKNLNETYRRLKQSPEENLGEEIIIDLEKYILTKWKILISDDLKNFLKQRVINFINDAKNQRGIMELKQNNLGLIKEDVLNRMKLEADLNIPILLSQIL